MRAVPEGRALQRVRDLVLPAALAALTVWLGFDAGGYFADTTGWAASYMTETQGQMNTEGTNHTPEPVASTPMSCSHMATRISASP